MRPRRISLMFVSEEEWATVLEAFRREGPCDLDVPEQFRASAVARWAREMLDGPFVAQREPQSDGDEIPLRFTQCDRCGRKSYSPASIGAACRLPQPDGSQCLGTFRRIDDDFTFNPPPPAAKERKA